MQNAEPLSLYCGDESDGETLSFSMDLKSKHDEGALRQRVRHLLEPLALMRKRM